MSHCTGERASEKPHLLHWWNLTPLVPSGAAGSQRQASGVFPFFTSKMSLCFQWHQDKNKMKK